MAEDITPSPPGDFPSSGRESSLAGEPVDLSAEIPPAARRQIPTAPYNPEPERERMRGWIALSLLAMLAVVLLLAFISMWAGMKAEVLPNRADHHLRPPCDARECSHWVLLWH